MKTFRLPVFVVSILLAALFLSGCAPAVPVEPTLDPQMIAATVAAIQTEAVQTVEARLTANAALTPSVTPTSPPTETPTPTQTPLPTATPTQRIIYIPATLAPTLTRTPSDFQCALVSQSPPNNTQYGPGADFDAVWVLKNTGIKPWDKTEIDLTYVSGTKMQKYQDSIDLPQNVEPGDPITLRVDMLAPGDKGTHTTTWALKKSGATLCSFSLTIKVVN